MILVDVNLLVYASVQGFSEHARARAWLDGKLNGFQTQDLLDHLAVEDPRDPLHPRRAAGARERVGAAAARAEVVRPEIAM